MEKIKGFLSGEGRRVKVIVILGISGVLLILLSDFSHTGGTAKGTEENISSLSCEAYANQLEDKLENIISSISGVGECKVMITLENTYESVYATNSEQRNDSNSSVNKKDEYVIYDADKGESPVLIKEYMPKVMGVTVVCSGGDNIEVKEKIISSVTSLFNLSSNRVSVSKIK